MFFYKLRQALSRMFYGRQGIDNLNIMLLCVYVFLAILNMFVLRINGVVAAYRIIQLILITLFLVIVFRAFSRNIYKRQAENNKYLSIKNRFIAFFKLQGEKRRNRKTNVYKRCPNCKAVIKLPRKKGKHTVCCPRCKNDFKVKI